jgi:hypothetical protein
MTPSRLGDLSEDLGIVAHERSDGNLPLQEPFR